MLSLNGKTKMEEETEEGKTHVDNGNLLLFLLLALDCIQNAF